jgi:uncharacterized protein
MSMFSKKNIVGMSMVIVFSSSLIMSQESDRRQQPPKSYQQEIKDWDAQRISGLKRPYGWLTLVMREWLNEGKNEFSSIGTLTVQKGTVQATIVPELKATRAGKSFTSGQIYSGADSTSQEKVEIGSRAFVVIERGGRLAVRMWDTTAEARIKFTGTNRFPVDSSWRITARWQAYKKPKIIKIASIVPGLVDESPVPGVAIFTIHSKEYRLEPIAEEGSDELFFIFADKTNGHETYDPGRFLYAPMPQDGKVILDFNKAYNPPCAFTTFATCPLPPAGNHLGVRIEAGEKKYGDHTVK